MFVKIPKKLLGLLAAMGVAVSVGSAEAAVLNDVSENSPIVLKQNSAVQLPNLDVSEEHMQPNYHYSHSSHSSHSSHTSHYSHYSARE